METEQKPKNKSFLLKIVLGLIGVATIFLAVYFRAEIFNKPKKASVEGLKISVEEKEPAGLTVPQLDTAAYDSKLLAIANNPTLATTTSSAPQYLWPVKTVYPNAGAILPFKRIVAYYGNLYSKNMGVLGEYSEEVVLQKLAGEVNKWQAADPETPVIPALHYIAVVAQAGPGKDGKFRARMPDKEIDKVLKMAEKINALVFLDIQVGLSNVQTEIPLLEKYLKMANVHLGIDPEFSMKSGARPGTEIGTLDAADVNFAAEYLAKIVRENNLPPKVLVIHRFTQKMLTNYSEIKPLPEVQLVMNMDGFGGRGSKLNTYKQYIYKQPVQLTGFKLFYKNDARAAGGMLEPEGLLKLNPIPVYIQYQ
ncbi:MAG: hypothetical protein HY918_05835 [Candidatus Doudnabacteria bacterium]|nr:hypothetical protein [Candidatus Doudnabacteria bacterium]